MRPFFQSILNIRAITFASIASVVTLMSCSLSRENGKEAKGDVEFWMTTGDKRSLLKKETLSFTREDFTDDVITVNDAEKFQSIDGFGFALTGGSAMLMHTKLDEKQRADLLEELFSTDGGGIGISYLRVSIGASDLDDHVFSYVDLAAGQKDPELRTFTLDEDRKHLIPVLKEILAVNPAIKIMGSPWSAPKWMKTNQHEKSGSLKPEFYPAYAAYFVKYIQEMQREGITIDAVTLQNEPENPNNTPSMLMTAGEQAEFVKSNLGPAFRASGIKTKIVVFDHNCDHPDYPITVMDDSEAKQYIDGSAFHLYLGDINVLSGVHEAHADRNIYFTEQWTSGEGDFSGDLTWHTKNLIIGATRNWSKNVLEWNLAADPNFDPHTDEGGCTICQGALTIGDGIITRNVSYYIIAHASRFVPDGSVRISSNLIEGIPNVAFRTPQGKSVLVALNESGVEKSFVVRSGSVSFRSLLPAQSVATYVW